MTRILALALLLAACGSSEPAPPPESPVQQRIDAARNSADEAGREIEASARRMEAEAAAARDSVPPP